MTDGPKLDVEERSRATRSDVLSHLLTLIRLRGELVYSAELTGSWNAYLAAGPSHLLFVEAGTVWLTPTGQPSLCLNAGDLALLPHGMGHSIADRADNPEIAVDLLGEDVFDPHRLSVRHGSAGATTRVIGGLFCYEAQPLPPVVQMLPIVIHIPNDGGQVPAWLQGMVYFLMLEARDPQPGSALMISRSIDLLVIRALRSWADLRPSDARWLTDLVDARIGRALQAIHAEPERSWTLASLCDVAGMSRSSFADRFLLALGDTPMRYLNRWRMAIAKQLLQSGSVSVGETGRRVGYASEAGFSRAFKAHYGFPPNVTRSPP